MMRKASWEACLLPPKSVDSLSIYGNSRNDAITYAEARALGIAPCNVANRSMTTCGILIEIGGERIERGLDAFCPFVDLGIWRANIDCYHWHVSTLVGLGTTFCLIT